MWVTILGMSSWVTNLIRTALEWLSTVFHAPGNIDDMSKIHILISKLSLEQRQDFLELWQQWYCFIPDWVNVWLKWDVGSYLITLSPDQFNEYYISISKKREWVKKVQKVLEA